jgi:glycosyltransferase involved in cell wall biosynthesis
VSDRPLRVFMMDLLATVPYYTAYLSKALLAEGVDVMVGSITYYLDPDCFTSRGIKVDPGLLNVVGKFPLPRLPRRVMKLMEALVNLSALTGRFLVSPPEVIHVQFLPMLKWHLPLDLWFLKFCRNRGSRIVLTVHDLLPHNTGETYKPTFLELYRNVDRIICHSEHIRTLLGTEFSVPGNKVSVIPHGPFFYDLPATSAGKTSPNFDAAPRSVQVLWQGIISPYKGVDLLLRAWKEVEAQGGECRLAIVGTGAPELLEQIREQVKSLELQHVELQLRFISTHELVALYRAADIVVYPYRAITTSGALATGLALGKAIVASDLPVFRELLTDRENALLVDPQNSAELANALMELAQDTALREHLSSHVRAMDFGDRSWLSIAKNTLQVYRSAVTSYSSPASSPSTEGDTGKQ